MHAECGHGEHLMSALKISQLHQMKVLVLYKESASFGGYLVLSANLIGERMTKKLVVEFIGTFFLVLTVGLSVLAGNGGVIPPLAIGATLMVMIYAGGHISGAHYNPAVTLAVYIRGKCPGCDVIPYMLVQMAAAIIAASVVGYVRADAMAQPGVLIDGQALLAEFTFTFALAYVVLNVATSKATAGNSYYGMAIGFTVLAGAFAVGDISGAVFNPAVAVGVTLLNLSSVSNLWIFLIANFAGAGIAAVIFKLLNPDDL